MPIPSIFWLAAMVVFFVAEAITVGLTSIWFGVGALAALIISFFTGNIWVQIAVFLAASVRVLMANPKHPLLREFYQYMQQHFPQFQSNRYVSQLPRAKKIAFNLLCKKRYRIVRALFLVKNRL